MLQPSQIRVWPVTQAKMLGFHCSSSSWVVVWYVLLFSSCLLLWLPIWYSVFDLSLDPCLPGHSCTIWWGFAFAIPLELAYPLSDTSSSVRFLLVVRLLLLLWLLLPWFVFEFLTASVCSCCLGLISRLSKLVSCTSSCYRVTLGHRSVSLVCGLSIRDPSRLVWIVRSRTNFLVLAKLLICLLWSNLVSVCWNLASPLLDS